jgi:hypothetical protein
MEAVGELASNQATRLGRFSDAPMMAALPERTLHVVPPGGRFAGQPVSDGGQPSSVSDGGGSGDLARSLELLKGLGSTAVADAALLDFREAADFAANVEEISRAIEYLQLVAAGAVDRTRRQAAASAGATGSGAAVGWTTGWGTETVAEPDMPKSSAPDPADDGYRNTAEFLRTRLRISAPEARRRLSLAAAVLPRTGFTGHHQPPERPELGAALAAGTIASRPATIISLALDRVRHHAPEDTTARMEHALTRTAAENDTDFLTRIARRWTDAIDQDGTEPTETELRHRQGAFLRPTRRGLHHLEIFATADQYEHLVTVMNTATNPRTRPGSTTDENDKDSINGDGDGTRTGGTDTTGAASAVRDAGDGGGPLDADLDRRTRPQRLLDGLVGACKAALATGTLPTAGGLRPQVMVTIDYRDLLDRLEHATARGPRRRTGTAPLDVTPATGCGSTSSPNTAGDQDGHETYGNSTATIPGTGSFTFTGPVTAATVRKIACDADIIPVLLGSEGRILDIGRTIPAPWCEAHHITYWSHGGTTGTDNGTLLCSHHHHLIHKEQWQIQVKTGIPWFIPPPHIDPHQQPQRNNYFRC